MFARLRRRVWSDRRRRYKVAVGLVIAGGVGINAIAFVQARAMTHFVPAGVRTASPEKLTAAGKLAVLLTGVRLPRSTNPTTPADRGLPYDAVRLRSDGLDLEAWHVPAGAHRATVVLLHGYGASKSSLLGLAVPLHGMGYDLLLLDFRGAGGSAGDVTTIGYSEADDVAAAVAYARAHPDRPGEPVVLYGQSMGAAAAVRAVGVLGVRADAMILESVYDRLLSTAGNRFRSMGLPAFPLAHLLVFWGGVQQGYWAFGLNPADFAAGVTCPTLVLQGGRDPRVSTAQARTVYDALTGLKAFALFPAAGHCAFAADDPARWRATVGPFFDDAVGQNAHPSKKAPPGSGGA